jgi:hypothetical protein
LLSSVLAVLALACLPLPAQADSSEVQYDPAINGPGGKPEGKEQIAKKSESPKPNGGASAPTGGGSGGSGGSVESGGPTNEKAPSSGSGAAGAAGDNGGTGQGKAEPGSSPAGKANVQHAAPTSSTAPAGDDDGSSPLLPILIGALVLAAISVGAFIIRQRRQRDAPNPSLSTKAG